MRIAAVSGLHIDPVVRPGVLRLEKPWELVLEDGRFVLVPAGFRCDGCSAPYLSPLRASALQLLPMGIAHDYAVREGALIYESDGIGEPFTVEAATRLAAAVAAFHGVGRRDRAFIRIALRLAAPTYWRKKPVDWKP